MFVVLPDVGNLQTHNDVRIAGARIGQVLKTSSSGGRAKVELQLTSKLGDLPADTTAVVRSAGLLGTRYLELVPGKSQKRLAAGGTVRAATPLSLTLGVPEALQTFDRETRGAMAQVIDGVGTGLVGRSRGVNAALDVAPQAATDFRTVARAVTVNPDAARALVPSLASAGKVLDDARVPLVDALPPTAEALTPFVERRSDVRAMLDATPPALDALRPGLVEGRQLLGAVRQVARAVDVTLPDAPSALRRTTALLRSSQEPLRRTKPLLAQAETAVPAALKLTGALDRVVKPLKEPLDNLVAPVRLLGEHGCDVSNFARNWRSFLGFGVPGGGKIGPLGEIRAEALITQPFAEAGPALQLPDSLVDRTLYAEPCVYRSTAYSLTDPTK